MMIGGNITAILQTKNADTANRIGEHVASWTDKTTLFGWLDLSNGDSKHTTFNTKAQESTHVFLCDYVAIGATPEESRLVISGKVYEVLLIDDPMERHRQIEIYLKYIGGANNGG